MTTAIIQIFKHKEIFTKETYTSENRNKLDSLGKNVLSPSGFLENEILNLPMELKNKFTLENPELVIIQDVMNETLPKDNKTEELGIASTINKTAYSDSPHFFEFRQLNSPKSFEIFSIRKSTINTFELSLNYNRWLIGVPKRDNHQICDLKPNKPVRYKINGKGDFTMSGRKQRTYYEFDYVIEWIGNASKINFLELNKIMKAKGIPMDTYKLIDERKILF